MGTGLHSKVGTERLPPYKPTVGTASDEIRLPAAALKVRGDVQKENAPPIKSQNPQISFSAITTDVTERLKVTQRTDNGTGYVSAKHNRSGADVRFWQEQFKAWAIKSGDEALVAKYSNMAITDSFDSNPQFTDLIKDFQSRNGLRVDGIIGPRTFRAFAKQNYFSNNDQFELVNLGREGFESQTKVTLLSDQEYELLIAEWDRARRSSGGYPSSMPLPPALDAAELLKDPQKVALFQKTMDSHCGGRCVIAADRFLAICAEYKMDPSLALAQVVQECHGGVNPAATRSRDNFNLWNVGNTDSGANRQMREAGMTEAQGWENGMREYCKLMTRSYGNAAEDVIARNFQRVDGGGRYASDSTYDQKIRSLVGSIRQQMGAEADYSKYYAEHAPKPAHVGEFSGAGCRDHTIALAGIIRKNFPGVGEIGGWRPWPKKGGYDNRHPRGLALDCMVGGNSAEGDRLAQYLIEHAEELGVSYFIWKQRSWRAGRGWGGMMEDRGDATANHYDHVHVGMKENVSLAQLPGLQRLSAAA